LREGGSVDVLNLPPFRLFRGAHIVLSPRGVLFQQLYVY